MVVTMLFIIVLLKTPPEYKYVTSYNFRFVIDDSKLLKMYLIKERFSIFNTCFEE